MSETHAPVVPIRRGLTGRRGDTLAVNDMHELLTGPGGLAVDEVTASVAEIDARAGGVSAALLRSAQSLAAWGWPVFPCVPGGKRPALRGSWQDHATADPAQIRAWWARAPYNIGIACAPSGLVVLDLDTPRQQQDQDTSGTDALAALCEEYGQPYPLPTYVVDTPSGGSHLYYATPQGRVRNSASRLGRLIDVRADGGYVIGADSRIGKRAYTARDQRAPVPLPEWITALLHGDTPAAKAGPASLVPESPHGTAYAMAALREEIRLVATARPGTRNDTLNRAAFSLGQLAAAGLLPPLAVATALASAARQAGLPADEARRTIRSGMTAGARHPREIHRSAPAVKRHPALPPAHVPADRSGYL